MKHLPIPLNFASHLLLLWAPCGRPRVRPDFCSRQQPLPPYLAYSDEVPFLVPKLKIIILSKFTSVLLHFKKMNRRTLSRDYFKIKVKALTVPTKSPSHKIGAQEKRFGSINLDFLHLHSRNNFIRSGHFYIFHKDLLMSQEEKKSAIQCLAQLKPIYFF